LRARRVLSQASREVVAIKVVQRAKMTSKLLENLEAEITILKAIHHPNIVGLEDCLVRPARPVNTSARWFRADCLSRCAPRQKFDERIYLIMDYCSGGDLSFYIKKRGRLPTLEFVPPEGGPKRFWIHPEEGGLDEVVVKCFLGQLSRSLPPLSVDLWQPWLTACVALLPASALKFLRSQNLIHRDIKPQVRLSPGPGCGFARS
jgi:serine/threonine-protein kinase ULK/ATG1